MNNYDNVNLPAKNKFQTEESVLSVVNNGKASLTKEDWQSVIYAAYQINAIQDIIATGYKGNPITDIKVESVSAIQGTDPKLRFTFTFNLADKEGKPTGDPLTITQEVTFPAVITSQGAPGPTGAEGPAGASVYIVYGVKEKDPNPSDTWDTTKKWIGISVASKIKPEDPNAYTWCKFIDKHINAIEIVNTDNTLKVQLTWDDGTFSFVPIKETACIKVTPQSIYIGVTKLNDYVAPKEDTQVIIQTGYENKQEGKTLTLDKGIGTINNQSPITGNVTIKTGYEDKNEAGSITLNAGALTVNNQKPVQGNVTIDTGVMKVNGIAPVEGNATIDTGVMKVNGVSPVEGNISAVSSIKISTVEGEPVTPDSNGLATLTLPATQDAANVTDQIAGHAITSIFETDGITAKQAKKATNADTAEACTGNAATATDVTTNINGKAITDIFELDGVTAKQAKKIKPKVEIYLGQNEMSKTLTETEYHDLTWSSKIEVDTDQGLCLGQYVSFGNGGNTGICAHGYHFIKTNTGFDAFEQFMKFNANSNSRVIQKTFCLRRTINVNSNGVKYNEWQPMSFGPFTLTIRVY